MAISGKQFAVSDARRLCRSLLDAVNDVVFIFEPGSLSVLAANKAACKIYGYTKKEMIGKRLQMLTDDVSNFMHVLRSGRTFERTDINKKGDKIELLVSLSMIDYWGRRAILSINRDISDRKRVEQELATAKDRLAAGLDVMTRLQGIGAAFVRGGDLSAVLGEVVETAITITRADKGHIQILDPATGKMTVTSQRCGSRRFPRS